MGRVKAFGIFREEYPKIVEFQDGDKDKIFGKFANSSTDLT